MEAANGESKDYPSSRRDDYSSSRSRDDYRSSRHDDRHDSSRYRDRDRSDRDKRYEDSSHHRSSHRDSSSRDYVSSGRSSDYPSSSSRSNRDYGSSNAGGGGSSGRDYGGSSSARLGGEDAYPGSRDRESRYDSRRGATDRPMGPMGARFSSGYGDDRRSNRKRSASPRRHRGPTPDLTNVVPIDERKRRLTMWDVKPQGYENVTAEQAKMSGLFPLPGAPRDPIPAASLQALAEGKAVAPLVPSLAPLEVPKLWALNANNSRQGRRLVVSKLPPSSTAAEIQNYFEEYTKRLNVYKGNGEAVKDCKKATSGGVAMVEFAEPVYATTVLWLEDEIEYNGVQLELRRPSEYIVSPPDKDKDPQLTSDAVTNDIPDSTEKLVIKGLPVYLSSEQGQELVEAFGTLQGWILISEVDSSESKGVAFAQFKDPAITPIAINSLNGMQLNDDHVLSCAHACVGAAQTASAVGHPGGAMGFITSLAEKQSETPRSRVLLLQNIVTGDDLMDADEYDEILQDVKEECDRFGKVLDLQIPRPLGRSGEGPGVGKVFVRFENDVDCTAALKGLAGRKFQERTVVASYYPEDNYEMSAW